MRPSSALWVCAGVVLSTNLAAPAADTPCAIVTGLKPATVAPRSAASAAAEQQAYLAALRSRFTGEAVECFPGDLPQAEKERIIEENGALPPPLTDLDAGERFFTAGTIWTGDGQQGPSGQAIPAHLTYSFPADGTLWGISSRPVVPNDLNSALGHVFGGANFDLGREMLRQALAGWRRFSGLTYTEVADDNSQQDANVTRLSTRGDCRLGAGFAWPDTYLAYNFFPTGGSDMFFNSRYWEGTGQFGRTTDSYRYLRNVAAHEHGHGNGSIHTVPCSNTVLMEPFINVNFDQQQIDDIRNVNRGYGDRFAGNNSAANARSIGAFTTSTPRAVVYKTLSTNGADGPNNTDEDWFTFTVSGGTLNGLSITVTPTGGQYVNGQQSSGCSGTTNTVDASAAGNLAIELRNMGGTNVVASATGAAAGNPEVLNAPSLANGTYYIRVFDQGPNDPVNQILQTYDIAVRRGSANAPPTAIAGVNKRIGANTACQFIGDINSYTNEAGATITAYDWDLDGNGTFETTNQPRPTTVYSTPGVRNVTLRVTDSNGQTATDTIAVDVFSEAFAVFAVSPYPFRNAQGTTVPLTIFGKGLSAVTSLSQISVSGTGVTLTGAPVVGGGGSMITGVSANVAANAPKGTRVVTVDPPGADVGTASFYLYPSDPGAFSIVSPGDGSTTATSAPVITWTASPNATVYFVQIANDAGFTSIAHTSPSTLTDTAWQTGFGVLSPSTTYFARVRSTNETSIQVFTPAVSFTTGAAATSNDSCADAFTVLAGSTPFNSTNSTTDGPDEPACESGGYSAIGNDIWFRHVASCTGSLTASVCGASHDSMMAVYADACPGAGGSLLACNDDACGTASSVTLDVTFGSTYYIRLGGWQGARGSGTLVIACTPSCPGDADGDGMVGLGDVAVMISHWTFSVPPGTMGDLSGNGVVGLEDLAITISFWGTSCE